MVPGKQAQLSSEDEPTFNVVIPFGQGVQAADSKALVQDPVSQKLHWAAPPVWLLNSPGEQVMHEDDPTCGAEVPAGHGRQCVDACRLLLLVPRGHLLQVELRPPGEVEPAWQLWQIWFTGLSPKPGGHER